MAELKKSSTWTSKAWDLFAYPTEAFTTNTTMAARGRRMTLPSIHGREDPIYRGATKPCSDPQHGACFIFLHGLGDDAEGLEGVYSIERVEIDFY